MEKSKRNVALFHLEMRLSKTFGQTEGVHSLFGFFKHGGLRDMEGK